MRVIGNLTAVLVLAVIAGSLGSARGASAQNLALPEVMVTAPPIAPAYRKWNPYGGNPRVEEEKWSDIPCSSSRIAAGAATGCKAGPSLNHPGFGLPQGDRSVNLSNCRIGHDLVITNVGYLAFEADVVIVDPYYVSATGPPHKGCSAEAGYGDLREDFPDMNQMTRKGSGWRGYADNGDLITMAFSIGASNCLALEKRGPRWRTGYVYVIHASICRNDGRPVEVTDIDYVLHSLLVRQYEPSGNLRPPPQ